MKLYTLCLFAICWLAVIAKSIDSNTKYYIYNQSTRKCLGRRTTPQVGFGDNSSIVTTADCNDSNNRWYIKPSTNGYTIRPVNNAKQCLCYYDLKFLSLNTCGQGNNQVMVTEGFTINDGSICTTVYNKCISGNFVISTSKPKKQ